MKRRGILCVLIIALMAVMSLTVIACRDPEPAGLKPGPESGTYYYDAADGVYRITLNQGDKFGFQVMSANKSGDYSLSGETLTFTFNKEEGKTERDTLPATYKNDTIVVSYSNKSMTFLRETEYTVEFDSKGGSAVAPILVTNGRSVSKPDDPVRANYRFMGWYTTESFNEPFLFDFQAVKKNTKLFASWVSSPANFEEYTISVNPNYSGAKIEELETTGGKLYSLPQTPAARENYEFKGWWVSMYDNADMLTYQLKETDMPKTFEENTTLFALWRSTASIAPKPQAPLVDVKASTISFASEVSGLTYVYEVVNVNNPSHKLFEATDGQTAKAFDFSKEAAGDYKISVTARSGSNSSDTTVRYYKNKGLARVSFYAVAEPSTLIFKEVKNATNYLIEVDCGDELHNHGVYDNGNSTYFNFSNCMMQYGGIEFTVTATANGYASSVSSYKYDKTLTQVTGFVMDTASQTLSWDRVPYATNYIVAVQVGEDDYVLGIDNGSKTSFSLKEYYQVDGGIEIRVYPRTTGWNSPTESTYTFNKENLATPRDIRIERVFNDGSGIYENVVTWLPVTADEAVVTYEVRIDGTPYQTATAMFVLPTLAAGTHEITVTAKSTGMTNSVPSDAVKFSDTMSAIKYSEGVLSWQHVSNAVHYEVQLNRREAGETPIEIVDGGINYKAITLSRPGINYIEVRSYNGIDNSDWSLIKVFAYTLSFDTLDGDALAPQYYAVGDRLRLPEATKAGYDFKYWYSSVGADGSMGARFIETKYMNEANMQLFAYWEGTDGNIEYNYQIEGRNNKTASVAYGQTYTLEVPAHADSRFVFKGWYSDAAGGYRYTNELGEGNFGTENVIWTSAEKVTLYAIWVKALDFELTSDMGAYEVVKGPEINQIDTLIIPETYSNKSVIQIKNSAFLNCTELKNIIIPQGITTIQKDAFVGCTALENIFVDAENEKYTNGYFRGQADGVLYEDKTTLLIYPLGKVGSYEIPYGVTTISTEVFKNNSKITGITIAKTVTTIGKEAFAGSALSAVKFDLRSTALTIDEKAFENCVNIEDLSINGNVTLIGENAFNGCAGLKTLTITEGTLPSTIGARAFANCAKLETATINNKLAIVEQYAFQNCTELTTVNLPATVASLSFTNDLTYVGINIFSNCMRLTDVNIAPNGVGYLSIDGVLVKKTAEGNELAYFPIGRFLDLNDDGSYRLKRDYDSNLSGADDAEYWEPNKIVTYTIPEEVTRIGVGAFRSNMGTITLSYHNPTRTQPNRYSLKTFQYPYVLGGVTLHDKITYIGSNAFYGTSIKSVTIPESVTYIGDQAFGGRGGGLASVTKLSEVIFADDESIDETLKNDLYIANSAFSWNELSGTLEIPGRVTFIGASAFSNNEGLTEVIIGNGNKDATLGSNAGIFAGCTNLTTITIGTTVKTIANNAFMNSASAGLTALRTINIGPNVTHIGDNAFSLAGPTATPDVLTIKFTEIEKSKLQTLGSKVFNGCSRLVNLQLPGSLLSMGSEVFLACNALTSITISEGNGNFNISDNMLVNRATKEITLCLINQASYVLSRDIRSIGGGAFSGRTSLVSVTFAADNPDDPFDDDISLVNIGANAFNGCTALTTFAIPASVETIGERAFNNCAVWNPGQGGVLKFSANVESIGNGAFAGCNLITNISVDLANTKYVSDAGVLYEKNTSGNKTRLLLYPKGRTDSSYEIPNGVTIIDDYAFNGVTGIIEITALSPLTYIGEYAFNGCSSLVRLRADTSAIMAIGNYTFARCAVLTSVNNTNNATGVEFINAKSVGDLAFNGCFAITSIKVPNAITIGASAFGHNGLTNANAVDGCKALTSMDLPNAISIGNRAFQGCSALTSINIPNITTLGNYVFNSCTVLTRMNCAADSDPWINIPVGITALGTNVFQSSGIINIKMPEGTTAIGGNCFASCASLVNVIIPDNTVEITLGASVFQNCTSLVRLVIPEGVKTINSTTFGSCSSLVVLKLPSTLLTINSAFGGCHALTSIIIPYTNGVIGVQKIAALTFTYSTAATSGAQNLTIYTEAKSASKPTDWSSSWAGSAASSWRPVVWGCTLSTDKTYVVSTVKEVTNPTANNGIKAPDRLGYTFKEWNTKTDGTGTAYLAANITSAADGTVLYAIWTANTYTITYKDVGDGVFSGTHGTTHPTQHTYTAVTTLVAPTKDDYTFAGWYTNKYGTGTSVTELSATGYTANITLYAKWTNNSPAISYFDVGGGAFSGDNLSELPDTHTYGTPTTLVDATKDDCIFDGWYLNIDGSGNKITELSSTGYTANITLYAKWIKNVFTITYFDIGGGAFSGEDEAGLPDEHTYGVETTLVEPTKENYTFKGWFINKYGIGTAITTLGAEAYTNDIVLYAKWAGDTYTITYKDEDGSTFSGSNLASLPAMHTYNQVTNLIEAKKTGHTFEGWFIDVDEASITELLETDYTDDIVLYAKWTVNVYSITYKDVGGGAFSGENEVDFPNEHTYGVATTLVDPIKEGYTFDGWFAYKGALGGSLTELSATGYTANITLYAKWIKNVSEITYFDVGGGAFSGEIEAGLPDEHAYGTATTFGEPTKVGYTFGGWYLNVNGTGTALTGIAANDGYPTDVVLYAKWVANKYTITYKDLGDGVFSGNNTTGFPVTHTYGTLTTLVNPIKTGYTFAGWFVNSNGTGTALTELSATGYTANITLYAKWIKNVSEITYFDVGGGAFSGEIEVALPVKHTYGTATTFGEPTKEGYTFDGWYLNIDGTGTALTGVAADDGYPTDIVLYAKWVVNS